MGCESHEVPHSSRRTLSLHDLAVGEHAEAGGGAELMQPPDPPIEFRDDRTQLSGLVVGNVVDHRHRPRHMGDQRSQDSSPSDAGGPLRGVENSRPNCLQRRDVLHLDFTRSRLTHKLQGPRTPSRRGPCQLHAVS